MCDLAKNPGPALRRAADHDARRHPWRPAPRALSRGESMSPLATTGTAQRGLDGGNGVVLGGALVALLARAAVHRDHLHAGRLGRARQAHRILFGLAPAGAHLQRDRHAVRSAGRDHGFDDLQRQRLVLHQGRAGPLVADFLGRAAHVDVDDLRAAVDVVAAASAIIGASVPAICTAIGPGSPSWLARREVFSVCHRSRRDGHHLADRIARAELAGTTGETADRSPPPWARQTRRSAEQTVRCS